MNQILDTCKTIARRGAGSSSGIKGSYCKIVLSICHLAFLVSCARRMSKDEFGPTAPVLKPGMSEQELALRRTTNMFNQTGSYEDTARRIVAQLERLSTPDELRRWGLSQIDPYRERSATDDDRGVGVPRQNWPGFVAKLLDSEPLAVSVCFKSVYGSAHVSIVWGSGLTGPYGVLIGARDYEPGPPGDPDSFYLKWADGIYAFTATH